MPGDAYHDVSAWLKCQYLAPMHRMHTVGPVV